MLLILDILVDAILALSQEKYGHVCPVERTNGRLGRRPRPLSCFSKVSMAILLPSPVTPHLFAEIFRDPGSVGQGLNGVVVYLHSRGYEDPGAVQDDDRRLPGPRETWQGRKEKFPINSGNWYKLCCHTIQSAFLFYWLHSLTHACN